jgi:cytochrome b
MNTSEQPDIHAPPRRFSVLVWDLPTRAFHWLLVACVATSFITAKLGVNAMSYHLLSGYTILALLIFRLIWGLVGSRPSRFSDFVKGPAAVWQHVNQLFSKDDMPCLGHNPLGGWSILGMLLAVGIQAASGLFASDDIFTEGPLHSLVGRQTSDFLTRIHLTNRYILLGLIGIHVLAVMYYVFYRRENLLKPMITGRKRWHVNAPSAEGSNMLAAFIFILALLAVFLLAR